MQFQTFQWVLDINADGHLSAWEVWETIRWIFRMPGSLMVELIDQSSFLSQFLNIKASASTGYASLDGLFAKVLSLFFWLPILMSLLSIGSKPKRKRRPSYLDENSNTQPLLLPKPKNYPHTLGRL